MNLFPYYNYEREGVVMIRKHLPFLRRMILILIPLLIAHFSNFCFAEESLDISEQAESNNITGKNLDKMTISFSDDAWGFLVNEYWQIREGELQFTPKKGNKSFLYYNSLDGYYLQNYKISVETRWIGGSDYSDYGLIFKYHNPKSYYVLGVSLDGYAIVSKYYINKWKTIKRTRYKSYANYDKLEVICKGNNIECFINEKKICSFKDDTVYNTSFGVCSEGDVKCGFKDFYIEEL